MPVLEDMLGAAVEGADFSGTRVERIIVAESSLQKVDLSDSVLPELQVTDAAFHGCNLANVHLSGGALLRTKLIQNKMSGMQARKTIFTDVEFTDCRLDFSAFSGAKFKRVTFKNCQMREADFSSCSFEGVHFVESDLSRALFDRIHVRRTQMSHCLLSGIRGLRELRGLEMEEHDIFENAQIFAAELGISAISPSRQT